MNKLEQAKEDHKKGNWESADKGYQEIINQEPNNAEVQYLYSTSLMSQNKLVEALKTIDKAIKLQDDTPAFFQTKGTILVKMGKADEALKNLNKALKGNSNLYQAQILVGHIHQTQGKIKDAEKHFKMAIKIDGKQPDGHVNLAKILIDKGDTEQATNLLKELELKHPDQAIVKLIMGLAFLESGAYSYAENYFQKVISMHPDSELASLYVGIAKLYTGDVRTAENLIHAFNQQYQNTREGLAALGLLAYKNKSYRTAIEYLRNLMGKGHVPVLWESAYVESLARLGQRKEAIDFYLSQEKKKDKYATYRLGELYELENKAKKARKQYKKIEQIDNQYIAALLGLARCYLVDEKFEKAEKTSQKVLKENPEHAEASFILITALLYLGKQKRALKVLKKTEKGQYIESYKNVFKRQHGLVLDKQEKYKQAMAVFKSNRDNAEINANKNKISEKELKTVSKFDSKIDDERKDPVFVVGTQSTLLTNFVNWMYEQGVTVLNDRMTGAGRTDVLYGFREINVLAEMDDGVVRIERKRYHQKVKASTSNVMKAGLFVDAMYLNLYQMSIIKKIFPNAKIILLTRDSADIWLSQATFGQEAIDSSDWNEVKNQLLSMGLNLTQVDVDKWLDNDKQTLETLSQLLEKELHKDEETKVKYWQKTFFKKGHWKKYKQFLGQ